MNVERELVDSFRIDCSDEDCSGYITLSVERVKEILDTPDEELRNSDEYDFECPTCPRWIRLNQTYTSELTDAYQLVVRVSG